MKSAYPARLASMKIALRLLALGLASVAGALGDSAGCAGTNGTAGCPKVDTGFSNVQVITPPSLQVGDQYQLIFVTSDSLPATSTNIADYNAFVTAEAAANPILAAFDAANGVTWTAIGSTTGVNAKVNAPSSSTVYNMNGDLIANAAQPLYADSLFAPIAYDQFGNAVGNIEIWTGNGHGGVASSGEELGSLDTTFGAPGYTSPAWEVYADAAYFGLVPSDSLPLYALSSEITVTPEPGTVALVLVGSALLFRMKWRWSAHLFRADSCEKRHPVRRCVSLTPVSSRTRFSSKEAAPKEKE